MQVSVQYASEHLEELLVSAQQGEEIEIAREGQPAAKIIVMPAPPEDRAPRLNIGRRILGAGEGELHLPSDEEWKALDTEYEDLMLNGPLFPEHQP